MVVVIGRHQHFRQDEYHGYNQKLGDYLHQALLSGRWFAVVRNIFYQVGRLMSENCNITDDIDGVVL